MKKYYNYINNQIDELRQEGLYKKERVIVTPQNAVISTESQKDLINFCANNYLGLAGDIRLRKAAQKGVDKYGFGLSSVRFICGTQSVHCELEERLSHFLGTENTILYSSCYDANGGLFETLLGQDDAIISDSLNHASIIDGIRLSKAQRFRFKNNDMEDLEQKLKDAHSCRFKLIATDGVFSMDGIIANLERICDLADKYDALVMVDDSHGVGFLGENGRGSHELRNVMGRVDVITGTLGKALGGASGGYTSGKKEIIQWLRQRSRPYLFSNSLAPLMAYTTLTVLDIIENDSGLREKLTSNTTYFRNGLNQAGFDIIKGEHPIVPLILGDAKLANNLADALLKKGIYVISFSYPVVPKDKARIRFQVSAAHSKDNLDDTLNALIEVGKEQEII